MTSQRRCLVSCGRVSHRNAIPFDPGADFNPGTQARTRIEQFAFNYSTLLNALHLAFNGEPERLDAAIGMMYDLRVLSAAMMQTVADPRTGQTVGPSFEFVHTQGGMG